MHNQIPKSLADFLLSVDSDKAAEIWTWLDEAHDVREPLINLRRQRSDLQQDQDGTVTAK